VHINQLLTHPWERGNRHTFSSVSDYHDYGKVRSNVTGLKYVIHGEEEYRIENKFNTIKKGSCLVVNEDRMIDTHVHKFPEAVLGICVSLDNNLLNDIYMNSILTEEKLADNGSFISSNQFLFCEAVFGAGDILCKYLEDLSKFVSKQTGKILLPQEEIFYGLAQHLLISQSLVKKAALQITAIRHNTKVELYKRINIARQKIEDEPMSDISMAELAADVCMSEYHFFRTFKQAIGISPNQYRLKVKIEQARQLLLQTKMPLHEIADATGFVDVQNLSKIFKKYFLVPPGKYRSSRE
jgi:AraC family transcriptional regulator